MKNSTRRSIASAVVMLAALWPDWSHAARPTWTVTAAEAGVVVMGVPGSGGGGLTPGDGTGIAPATKVAAGKFVVRADVSKDGNVVQSDHYKHGRWDDAAACKAALDGGDPELVAANARLSAKVEAYRAQEPTIKVDFVCEPEE